MESELRWKLSSTTVGRIKWQTIEDVFGFALVSTQKGSGDADKPLSERDLELARRAFDVTKKEFSKATSWIGWAIRYAIGGIVCAVGFSVAGGALLQITPWASVVPAGSLGLIFWLLYSAFGLARDQVMLELVPSRYALALELCSTRQDLRNLLARFLDETTSVRKKAQ